MQRIMERLDRQDKIISVLINKDAAGMSLIDWEAEWAESGTALAVGMVAAAVCVVGFLCAVAAEMAATAGINFVDWEAEWAESGTAILVGIIVAAVVALVVLVAMKKSAEKRAAAE